MTVNDLLSVINDRILELELGSTFTAQELLHDYWEKIPENMRTYFGLEFSKAVEEQHPCCTTEGLDIALDIFGNILAMVFLRRRLPPIHPINASITHLLSGLPDTGADTAQAERAGRSLHW